MKLVTIFFSIMFIFCHTLSYATNKTSHTANNQTNCVNGVNSTTGENCTNKTSKFGVNQKNSSQRHINKQNSVPQNNPSNQY